MDYQEAKQVCEQFAIKHKVIFDDEGTCGFGRECVGFTSGDKWIDFNPHSSATYEPIKECQSEHVSPPDGVDAYHKHDCLAVLGRGEDAVIQLAQWVKHMEAAGEVSIKDFATGAVGVQALFSGVMGRCVMVTSPAAER